MVRGIVRAMDAHDNPTQTTGDLLRFGRIKSVDATRGTCAVETGDLVTPPLPWIAGRAGALRIWSAPSVGEQCLLICPEGDTESGVVLAGLFCSAHPQPDTNPNIHALTFLDGAQLSYDDSTHALSATLPGGGTVSLVADGGIKITGDVEITGQVKVTGKIAATDDVTANGISLKGHKHVGVTAGSAKTGAPI